MMDSTIQISSEYSCVMLAASCTFLLNLWQMRMIGGMRKKLDIKYPQMYSDKHDIFNCYQVKIDYWLKVSNFSARHGDVRK